MLNKFLLSASVLATSLSVTAFAAHNCTYSFLGTCVSTLDRVSTIPFDQASLLSANENELNTTFISYSNSAGTSNLASTMSKANYNELVTNKIPKIIDGIISAEELDVTVEAPEGSYIGSGLVKAGRHINITALKFVSDFEFYHWGCKHNEGAFVVMAPEESPSIIRAIRFVPFVPGTPISIVGTVDFNEKWHVFKSDAEHGFAIVGGYYELVVDPEYDN